MNYLRLLEMTSLKKMSSLFKSLLIVYFFFPLSYSQQIDFQSPQNIKLFANFLFCEKDYLRAVEEYQKYLQLIDDDSVQFKVAIGYSLMNDQTNALSKFGLIKKTSVFYDASKIQKLKSQFLINIDSIFYQSADLLINSNSIYSNNAYKLKNTSLLFFDKNLRSKENFLIPFGDDEKNKLSVFYNLKNNPPYKSETLAGIFSAIIPGSGKIYTENYGDGITAFLLTGLFTYLAYTNFEHDHPTRAWIFTALGSGFYAGNVYGSIASAQIFNAKVNFDFNEGVKLFLQEQNYFTPSYDFCK
ncbi:MAG: hypothetical protein ABI638_07765 [Ignavibacteriota bacterium]